MPAGDSGYMVERKTVNEYWYKAFIVKNMHQYVLLDDGGDIRATASELDGIYSAKNKYGWGHVHKMSFNGKVLRIGAEMK